MTKNDTLLPRARSRILGPGSMKGVNRVYRPVYPPLNWNGELESEVISRYAIFGKQTTTDRKNFWPLPRNVKKTRLVDSGGNFFSTKTEWDCISNINLVRPAQGLTGRRTYTGPWLPIYPWSITELVVPDTNTMVYWGTEGINRSLPTAPNAGIAQFVGELKDLPKAPILSLYKAIRSGEPIRRLIRNGGSEYLNVEFGWRPLVKDMKDFHKSALEAEKVINQYLKDSGKVVRRRRTLRDSVDETSRNGIGLSIGIGPNSNVLLPIEPHRIRERKFVKIWLSASYTYYISAGNSWRSNSKRNEQILNKLTGSRVTGSTLYELAPWSWAIDWVSNLGSVIENLNAFGNDGLVLHYAYIMYEEKFLTECSLRAKTYSGQIVNSYMSSTQTLKYRTRASPFGFGVSPKDFTPRQNAIVAALFAARSS